MSNLGKTQAEWTRVLAREFFLTFVAPIRLERECLARFTRERCQILVLGDRASATPQIAALTLTGVNPGVNCTGAGKFFCRFVTNGGNFDFRLYTAAGASGLVAHATNVAASGTSALTADNSSGIGGSVTFGATCVQDITDLLLVYAYKDFPSNLALVFTGADSIDQDNVSREAASAAYLAAADRHRGAIQDLKNGAAAWATARSLDHPVARLNAFAGVDESSLSSETVVRDSSGNVTRRRGGLLPIISDDMADETTGGEQDILQRVIAAGAGVFDAANSGQGTLASHTPSPKCPVGTWTARCVDDTLGRESFDWTFAANDGSGEGLTFGGCRVERDFTGPRGFGPVKIRRTYTKTGDDSNLNLAAVTTGIYSSETDQNTVGGVLTWVVAANGANWDYSFYKGTAVAGNLVARATNVATGAAINASPYNGGPTITWTAGSAPVDAATGTITCNQFLVQNANGVQDKLAVMTSVTGTSGIVARILAEVFDATLNSDSSGSESLPDTYAMAGTFAPFLALDL